jgi:Derlin-2/3
VYFTGDVFFLQGLILALCYTATQDQRGQKAGFFFFTVPAQLVPYCMLGATLLMNPQSLPLQITGLVAAHLHDFLTRIYPEFGGGPNLLPTPAFMSRIMQTPRVLQRDYGTAFRARPPNQPAAGSSTGAAGSVLPDSWRSRGSGHRLGGD